MASQNGGRKMENLFWIPDIDPLHYRFLIPSYISDQEFLNLVELNIFPTFRGLYSAVYYALLLSGIRYVLHRVALKPLALAAMNLSYPKDVRNSSKLDGKFLTKESCKDKKYMKTLAKELQASEKDINNYLRMKKERANIDKKVSKFVEASWRFLFYLVFCFLGIRALFFPKTASWITDTSNYWRGWPIEHQIEPAIEFFYVIELGAYLHQLAWTEVSRSDATEMILHHLVTILLITCSYLSNFSRIGSIIILLHDTADIFLECAKCLNYTGKTKGHEWASTATDVMFGFFALTFFVSRLIYYPRFVVYDVLNILPIYSNNDWAGYYWFSGLLCTLECLHIFWFYLICRMVYRLVTTGIDKDERSDDEGEEDSEDESSKDD